MIAGVSPLAGIPGSLRGNAPLGRLPGARGFNKTGAAGRHGWRGDARRSRPTRTRAASVLRVVSVVVADRDDSFAQELLGAEAPGAGTILVADDDRLAREHVVGLLERHGFRVKSVEDGQQAVERATRGDIDLVMLDILMPRLNGHEACRLLKGMMGDAFLPVMLVTVKTDSASRVEGLKIGADDFVCKPFDEAELVGRVRALLRIKKLHDHVLHARQRLEQLSKHDELTGLYNYRYLHTRFAQEFANAEARRDTLACMLVDVDQLKTTNDHHGRSAGDRALKTVARVMMETVRESDVVARFGSDEFLALLPGVHFAGSVEVAERIWHQVGKSATDPDQGAADGLPLSIGVAYYPSRDVRTRDGLLRGVDGALHQAKREGGNRVCVFQQNGCVYTPVAGKAVREMTASQPPRRRASLELEILPVQPGSSGDGNRSGGGGS